MKQTLRYSAYAEALTLLGLVFVAVPLKYVFDLPQATAIVGPIHGGAFVLFLAVVVLAWAKGLINRAAVARLFIGSVIPFGGIVNERWLNKKFAESASNAA